jgi:hypothetical protein
LNRRPLPSLAVLSPQVAVFGGVLEYIQDVSAIAAWLAEAGIGTCVVSFDPAPADLGMIGRCREAARRTYFGYLNNLTEDQLMSSFAAAGYACALKKSWTTQVICQFEKERSAPVPL